MGKRRIDVPRSALHIVQTGKHDFEATPGPFHKPLEPSYSSKLFIPGILR